MAKKKGVGNFSTGIVIIEGTNEYRLLRANSRKALHVVEDRATALKYAKKMQTKSQSAIFVMNEKGILTKQYSYRDSPKADIVTVVSKKKQ